MKERNQNLSERLSVLESRLEGALQPVKPKREFVQHVRNRIRISPAPTIVRRLTDAQYMLILIGSITSVIILIITGARAIFYLINRSRHGANL